MLKIYGILAALALTLLAGCATTYGTDCGCCSCGYVQSNYYPDSVYYPSYTYNWYPMVYYPSYIKTETTYYSPFWTNP